MGLIGYDDMLAGRPARITRPPVTATVVTSDETGVYVVPVDGDTRHPIGPCRGGTRLVLVDDALVTRPLPVNAAVLLVFTDAGPWVANWEGAG